jgi:hypothetical protein
MQSGLRRAGICVGPLLVSEHCRVSQMEFQNKVRLGDDEIYDVRELRKKPVQALRPILHFGRWWGGGRQSGF